MYGIGRKRRSVKDVDGVFGQFVACELILRLHWHSDQVK